MTSENPRQTSDSVIRNAKFGVLTWILPLGLSFVATPVLVKALGHKDYGIYALILGLIGYSFTFNLGRAVTKFIAEYRVSGRGEKIRDIISASFFLNLAVGAVGVLSIVLLSEWLVADAFAIDHADREKTVTAMRIASAIIFITMLSQVFGSVLQGLQRFDAYSKIFTSSSIVLISGNLALAYLGYDLIALLYWNLAALVATCIAYAIAAKRLLPEFGLSFRVSGETLRLVMKYSSGVVLYQIAGNVLLLFERGWIAQRLGVESLTLYVVPMSLGIYLHGFVVSFIQIIFPLASEIRDDPEKLLRVYKQATRFVGVLVAFVITTFAVQSGRFLQLWMDAEFSRQTSDLLSIFIISFSMVAIASIAWQITEGLGYPLINAAINAISTAIGIVLMILLINEYGIEGVAIARLAGFTAIFLSIFLIERRFFGSIQVRFWAVLVSGLALASAGAAIIEYSLNMLLPVTWLALVISAGAGGLGYLIALRIMNFATSEEKQLIRKVFSK